MVLSLACLLPVPQAHADAVAIAQASSFTSPATPPPTPPPYPVMFQDPVTDLSVKVWGGSVVIQRGYNEGVWYPNLNWMPLKVTYDSLDNTVQSITRGRADYSKAAPGVYQDQNGNTLRQTDTGFRWNDPTGNWIEYNPAGEIKAYGDRNGTIATFQYSGGQSTATTGTPPSEGFISGIFDHYGTQILWFDYSPDNNGTNRISRIRDAAGRKVEYQTNYTIDTTRSITYISGMSLTVLDINGNTWSYSVTGIYPIPPAAVLPVAPWMGNWCNETCGPAYTPPPPLDYIATESLASSISITDPERHVTTRSWYTNGTLAIITHADGSKVSTVHNYDSASNIFYARESGPYIPSASTPNAIPPGTKLVETWSELKQDLNRGDFLRKDINGVTVAKQSTDTASHTTTVTDARGLNTAVTRDQWYNITKTVYPDGATVGDQYDSTYSNVTRHTDENGIVTQNSYDAHGNLLKTVEAAGTPEQRTTEYSYDADGQRLSMTRKGDAATPDAVTRYEYDNNGNVITVTDPEGGITRYTFDAMGNALTKTDPRGKVWKRSYDNLGHLLGVTDPLKRTTTISYDKTGLPVSLTDAANNTSTLGYDAGGKLLTVTDPYGAKTSYGYDKAGNPITLTDAASHVQKQEYDPNDRLTKQTDGNGNVTQFVYGDLASGLNGLLTQIIYPTLSQTLQYDQRDRIVGSTDSSAGSALALDGSPTQTTKNGYDKAGHLTGVTDPANRSTGTKYNGLGQVTQTIDPANGLTGYGYDARGNLTSVTDAKGNTHRFGYDRLDRMVMEIRPLGQTIAYAYDANGNLIQVTDPKGQVKQYVYDDANRRTQENHYLTAGATSPAKSISYTYNILDRLTGYNDGATQGTYTYDTQQLRQIGESVSYAPTVSAPTGFTLSTGTTYNALGQKSSITYPDGAQYGYTYDTNNQLSTVNLPTGFGSITFNSYQWIVPSQITLPGGTVRNMNYDGLLRLKTLAVKDPGQSQVLTYQYNYDLTNNIVTKATEAGTTNYSYDTLDRLNGAAYTGSAQANEAYSYDPVANRLTDNRTTATWVYDANNQLVSAGSVSYTYDANGNTTNQTDSLNSANTRNYTYDIDNRLIEVRDGSNALIASYRYDPFGRRLSKIVVTGGTSTTQYYFYSAAGLIAEADASGQIIRSYGYAPKSRYTTNSLFTKVGNNYYYYQNDHLGTPMKLINQSGVVVWSATYDAFGKATVDPSSTITNNLRFPGQYADTETGLHYNWMRYYNPTTGRYVSSDPIGLKGGVNEFAYVGGRPNRFIDQTGLITKCELLVLIRIVNKYGTGPKVNYDNFGTDPTLWKGHAGKTNSFTNRTVIGTNPSDDSQYGGSVMARDLVMDVIGTAMHENTHQGQTFYEQSEDSVREQWSGMKAMASGMVGGPYIPYDSAAERNSQEILYKNPGIVDEFKNYVTECRKNANGCDPEIK